MPFFIKYLRISEMLACEKIGLFEYMSIAYRYCVKYNFFHILMKYNTYINISFLLMYSSVNFDKSRESYKQPLCHQKHKCTPRCKTVHYPLEFLRAPL